MVPLILGMAAVNVVGATVNTVASNRWVRAVAAVNTTGLLSMKVIAEIVAVIVVPFAE